MSNEIAVPSSTSRRDFLGLWGRVAVLAALAPRAFAEVAEQFSPAISDLYRKSVVIDTLCAPFTNPETLPDKAAIDVVRKSGITAINFTISERTFDETIASLAYIDALIEQSPDVF